MDRIPMAESIGIGWRLESESGGGLRRNTQLRAIFNESSLEAEKFKYIFSVAADVKIFDFECIGYYHNDQLVSLNSVFSSGIRLTISATATVTAGEPSVTALKEYDGPRNLDSVLSYTWEQTRGGPSGEFEEEAHTVI